MKGCITKGIASDRPARPDSILLQVTLGCSHNRCAFCGTYRDKRFRIKDERIIRGDILYAARHMQHEDRLFLMDGDALIIPQPKADVDPGEDQGASAVGEKGSGPTRMSRASR